MLLRARIPLLALAMCSPGICQTIVSVLTTPTVLTLSTQNVLLEARISGAVSRVTLEPSWQTGLVLDMKDDGAGGDKTAGDGIYTVQFAAAPLLASLRPDDVFRVLIGFINLFQGSTSISRAFTVAEVYTSDIPMLQVTSDGVDVQHTDYVVNVLMPSVFSAAPGGGLPDVRPVAQRFYRSFPDNFDVLNVVFAGPSFPANRFHFAVQNAVKGTGVAAVNSASAYGSAGKLLGISEFPISAYFDGADTAVQHEFGHQFIAFLKFTPALTGASPHWPFSTMASGIMGFTIPGTGAGGEFACLITPETGGFRLKQRVGAPVFSDLDLYLMGLMPASEVSDQYVFRDQSNASLVTLCDGRLYTAGMDTLKISEVIAAVGSRVPDAAQSQKTFRLATIVLTRDSLLTPEAMALYSYFAKRMEEKAQVPYHQGLAKGTAKPFAIATGGRGALIARITSANPSPLPVVKAVANAGSYATAAVSPGENVVLFGDGIGPPDIAKGRVTALETSAGDTRVLFDGVPAPVIYASSAQTSVMVPYAVAGRTATSVQVEYKGVQSVPLPVNVLAAVPGIYTLNQTGSGPGAILNQDGVTVNGPSTPAAPGSVVVIFMTGEGQTAPPGSDGSITPADGSGLKKPVLPVTATVGGAPATVLYAGSAPGILSGVMQVNLQIPPNASAGALPVVIMLAGAGSTARFSTQSGVTVSVK